MVMRTCGAATANVAAKSSAVRPTRWLASKAEGKCRACRFHSEFHAAVMFRRLPAEECSASRYE